MLSAQEISGSRFDKHMGRGYKQEQVDAFLQQIASDYQQLQKENAELEKKLLVLADKLEEYRQDEESLRSALIGAQKLGDSVIRDAKAKAAAILEDANAKAAGMLENSRRTISREQQAFIRTRREITTFKSKLMNLYKQHLELIEMLPVEDAHGATDSVHTDEVAEPVPEVAALPIEAVPEPVLEVPEQEIEQPNKNFSSTDEIPFEALDDLESGLDEEPTREQPVINRAPAAKERPAAAASSGRGGRADLKFGNDYNLWGKKK